MKNSIPYAQGLRYRRIISDDLVLITELHNLTENFISRGYPPAIIEKQVNKILSLDRSILIQYKERTNTNINFTPFVLTFTNIFNNCGKNNIYNLLRNI